MLFDLEKTSARIAGVLLKEANQEEKVKAEYGLSIVLGIMIELGLALFIALIIKTFLFTLIIMLSALLLRITTGGRPLFQL